MDSDAPPRDWRAVARLLTAQALVFACGGVLVLAAQGGLFACAVVLFLAAVWLAAGVGEPGGGPNRRPRASPPPPPKADHLAPHLLTSLLDQTPAPLLMRSPDGVVRAGNRAARALFGVDDRLVAPNAALAAVLRDGAAGDRSMVSLATPAGARSFAVSLADLASPAGPTRLAALLDIEPELRAAEAGALREILQILSHEIMNALTPVASLAATAGELLADETRASNALAREAVATLGRRAEGLTRFVEAYRTLARLPPPQLRPTRVGALVDEAVRMFESRWRARGVRLDVANDVGERIVSLDLDLMLHALLNILTNGAEAALATAAAPAVSLGVEPHASGVSFVVADNGAGVAAAERERIFQPFFTTKREGTGVGLSFAHQVALSHGGDLSLVQTQGGAVFRVTI